MSSREQIASMMRDALPECPFCGSKLGYNVISVIKGHVQCKLCGATWSSKDFLLSNRVSKLRITDLPRGMHSYNIKGHLIKRYEEYPLSFWRSLYEAKHPHMHVRLNILVEFLAAFTVAFIIILPGFTTHDIGWDEPVYVFAGRAYVIALAERNFFGDVWQWNHEHPPLAKYIYGFFSLLLSPILGNPYYGARIATTLMSALTAAIVYMFSRNFFGKIVGLFSMILLISTPFYYGMSRYVSLDLPVTFFICAYITLFYFGIKYERALLILLSSIFFGLAGSVRVSGFIGLLVLVLWFVLIFGNKTFKVLTYYYKERISILLSLFFYPILGIVIFILLWPWLWNHTIDRLIGFDGVLTYAARFKVWGHEEFFEGKIIWHPPPTTTFTT
ncbi:MAG: glycosyltransferase family 39 protein [Candidatus Bathyarchaeia archaeon]